jgi:hypothetical protein
LKTFVTPSWHVRRHIALGMKGLPLPNLTVAHQGARAPQTPVRVRAFQLLSKRRRARGPLSVTISSASRIAGERVSILRVNRVRVLLWRSAHAPSCCCPKPRHGHVASTSARLGIVPGPRASVAPSGGPARGCRQGPAAQLCGRRTPLGRRSFVKELARSRSALPCMRMGRAPRRPAGCSAPISPPACRALPCPTVHRAPTLPLRTLLSIRASLLLAHARARARRAH